MTDLPDFLRRDANNVAPYMKLTIEMTAEGYGHFLDTLANPSKPTEALKQLMQSPFPWEPA